MSDTVSKDRFVLLMKMQALYYDFFDGLRGLGFIFW